ncbi:hypothetical protein L211DRAFT_833506 [Terfezia boudieri ATCC MYA-4762]|uniref:Uncharacterized protein n=1 Tax=Terfezia boudieri ATCC MYA-4762 TaxID=1051890 RepID=A0A3N4M7B4_9PEZI|nr:hypothetical protein L211DRAFT_833506 [Terfezia boudieri ATCC MYA-4762]
MHRPIIFSNGPNMYYDDTSNPPPVIRDVQARRNTRIETPTSAHFPQQGSSGIAQNLQLLFAVISLLSISWWDFVTEM